MINVHGMVTYSDPSLVQNVVLFQDVLLIQYFIKLNWFDFFSILTPYSILSPPFNLNITSFHAL